MSLQSSLGHIIGLTLVLLATSFLPLPIAGLKEALIEVRLPLVMALGVAILYFGLVQRSDEQAKSVAQRIEPPLERHR
jgi:hypothetical protein